MPSVSLALLVRLYCRLVWRRPGLARRALFYVPTWRMLLSTALNEVCYRLRLRRSFRLTCAVVELSARCNLRCTICARHQVMTRPQGHMALETFRSLVDGNPGIGMYILVGWGEMMLNGAFWEAVEHLRRRGKRIALTTNATLLDEANVERLLASGIGHVTVSMDGVDQVYEAIRGIPFARLEANVRRLSRRIAQTGAPVYLEINAAATPAVVAQEAEMRRRLGPYVDDIRLSSYVEYNRQLPTNRTRPCRELWRGMITVWYDGTVVPCCMDYNTTMPIGSVGDGPLQDLWNGQASRAFRREHTGGRFLRRCATCYEAPPVDGETGIEARFVD
ncbi:MAG: radical SAM/SPASM domain-containing protein [Candidatus Latescibacterota bacterium]